MGLVLEPFGLGAVVVRETPAVLGEVDVQGLVRDLADELAEMGDHLSLKEKVEEVCGTLACHTSVARRPAAERRGNGNAPPCARWRRRRTPASGNHGRPNLCRTQAGRYRAAVRKTMTRLLIVLALLSIAGAAQSADPDAGLFRLRLSQGSAEPVPTSALDGNWRGTSDGGSCNAPPRLRAHHRERLRRRPRPYDNTARGPKPNTHHGPPPAPTPGLLADPRRGQEQAGLSR